MSAEAIVYAALSALVNGNVFPDLAPAQTPPPWICYTAVGGQSYPSLDGTTPGLRNARMQVVVYSRSRSEAASVMEQVFQALANQTVNAVPIGAPVSTFEADTLLYGSSLDFSITFRIT